MKTLHVECETPKIAERTENFIMSIGGIVSDPGSLEFYVAIDPLVALKKLKKLQGKEIKVPQMTIKVEGDKIWLKQ